MCLLQSLRIQDLQQEKIKLHRDIYVMAEQLGKNFKEFLNQHLANNFQQPKTDDQLGHTEILGKIFIFNLKT